jgi:RsiW-degrading membrane proteinase PrsW (M82 family)
MIFAVLAALAPALVLVVIFVKSDRFPEPTPVIVRTFLFGVAIVFPVVAVAGQFDGFVLGLTDLYEAAAARAFLQAGFIEEAFKLLVLVGYCMRRSAFDEPMDGLVYGAVASLGFAGFENVLYVADALEGDWRDIAIMRALTAVPGHAVFGIIMGFFCARAHFDPERRRFWLLLAWLVPGLLHGLYDWPLFVISFAPEDAPRELGDQMTGLWLVVFAVAIVIAWRLHARIRATQMAGAD